MACRSAHQPQQRVDLVQILCFVLCLRAIGVRCAPGAGQPEDADVGP